MPGLGAGPVGAPAKSACPRASPWSEACPPPPSPSRGERQMVLGDSGFISGGSKSGFLEGLFPWWRIYRRVGQPQSEWTLISTSFWGACRYIAGATDFAAPSRNDAAGSGWNGPLGRSWRQLAVESRHRQHAHPRVHSGRTQSGGGPFHPDLNRIVPAWSLFESPAGQAGQTSSLSASGVQPVEPTTSERQDACPTSQTSVLPSKTAPYHRRSAVLIGSDQTRPRTLRRPRIHGRTGLAAALPSATRRHGRLPVCATFAHHFGSHLGASRSRGCDQTWRARWQRERGAALCCIAAAAGGWAGLSSVLATR